MRTIFLLRHGLSENDFLTSLGHTQIHFAAERFKGVWNRESIAAWHAPAMRAKGSATLFMCSTGIWSVENSLLRINTFHDEDAHRAFATIALKETALNILLIGHDENRRHMEAIVRLEFGDECRSPRIPQGGLLRYAHEDGYQLI